VSINFLWGMAPPAAQIASAQRLANEAHETARVATNEIADVMAALERLSLISRAVWELLQERTQATEDDLLAKVRELDLRDGRLDGKLAVKARNCTHCQRVNNAHRQRCLYCGTALSGASAFDSI